LVDGFSFRIAFASVEITGENARVSVTTKEDERVGERFEPGCHGGFESST